MTEFALNLMLVAKSLAAVGIIALAALGMGRAVLVALRLADDDSLATVVWSLGLGFVAGGLAWTALGLVGLLFPLVVIACTFSAAFWGLGEAAQTWFIWRRRAAQRAIDVDAEVAPAVPRGMRLGLIMAVGLVCLATFVTALAPTTAGDALCYHLELPKAFLANHSLVYLPYHDNCTFPLLAEMLYLWGLACDGPVAAGLIAWTFGLLLGGAAVLLTTPILGRSWALVAGAVTLLVPGIATQMTAPLCDAAVALWTTLSLVAWRKAIHEAASPRWLLVAGVMLGASLSTKHTAWLFVVALVVVELAMAWRPHRARARVVVGLGVALSLAAVIAAPWYIRAWRHRGDPFYPVLSAARGVDTAPATVDKTPLSRTLAGLIAAPWQATLWPERFGGHAHQMGPVFLMLLPGLLLVRRLRGLGSLLAIAAVYGLLWFLMRQNVRFLYPVVPLLAAGSVWTLIELKRLPGAPRALAIGCLSLVLGASAAMAMNRGGGDLLVALGLESREAYLIRREPSYTAALVINRLAGANARILSEDYRGYYFEGQFDRESTYRRLTSYHKTAPARGNLAVDLKRRGYTHLVLLDRQGPDRLAHAQVLSNLVEKELDRQGADPGPLLELTSYEAIDAEGVARNYRLFMLR
ncbi:MAG: glycosyltransferase family 39 protein [Pirellulales bacterium]|nr:glycosyltransferase family 39 protein [Pirellulales bacterium]